MAKKEKRYFYCPDCGPGQKVGFTTLFPEEPWCPNCFREWESWEDLENELEALEQKSEGEEKTADKEIPLNMHKGTHYTLHWLEHHPVEDDEEWKEMLPPTAEITGVQDDMSEWEIVEGFEAGSIKEAQRMVGEITDAEVYSVYKENLDGSQELAFTEEGIPKGANVQAAKDGVKVEIIQKKIDKDHNDSFWYDGEVASVTYKDRQLVVIATGDIGVVFADGEETFRNQMATKEANSRNLTDKDMKNWDWRNNNWFEFFDPERGDIVGADVAGTYDEAIKWAKEMVVEDEYWSETGLLTPPI